MVRLDSFLVFPAKLNKPIEENLQKSVVGHFCIYGIDNMQPFQSPPPPNSLVISFPPELSIFLTQLPNEWDDFTAGIRTHLPIFKSQNMQQNGHQDCNEDDGKKAGLCPFMDGWHENFLAQTLRHVLCRCFHCCRCRQCRQCCHSRPRGRLRGGNWNVKY